MRARWSCLAAAVLVVSATVARAQPVRAGDRAPEIDLPTLEGGRLPLSSLRGHPVVLSFWGTWCPPCRDEFPALMRAYQAFAPGGLRVLGVNGRDQERRTKDVHAFVETFGVTFPIVLDERGRARRAYGLIGLPTTVFIDSGGVVQRVHIGPIGRASLDSGISAITAPRTRL